MAGPRITAVEAVPVSVTGLRDFRISEGETRSHVSVIVRIRTDHDDMEGIGEIVSAPPGKPEEFLEEIVGAVRRWAGPALVGLRAAQRSLARARIDAVLKGRPWTKAGICNALCDLHAKSLGVPAMDLIGGRCHDSIPVMGMVIGIMEPDDMARVAAQEIAAGYDTIKIKIGETPERDVARVAAVREAVGPDVQLRIDANDHYHPGEAIRLIRAIERYRPEHVEQPVGRGDLLGMAEVHNKVGVPIMTDDTVVTAQDAMNVVRLRAANRVKIKVTKHGLEGALLLTRMLEAAGISCVLGHVFEMGLAAAAEAQFAAACSNLVLPHEIGSLRPMGVTQDIITAELQPKPGSIELPDAPGLGVILDWERIRKWRVS